MTPTQRSEPPARSALAALALACAAGASACFSLEQRVPGPLPLASEPETPAAPVEGAQGVALVQRDSDPVYVRRAGERGEVLLPFFRKRERLTAGAGVRTGARGRAEILWAPDASTLVLFDEARVTLGDPEQDEPMVHMYSVTRALLLVTPEDLVELPGGALLRGDPSENSGPILLERVPVEILRTTNQTKHTLRIDYRDLSLELGPGESIDLPDLPPNMGGSAPVHSASQPEQVLVGGLALELAGRVERSEDARGVELVAAEPAVIRGLGVEIQLSGGETVRLSGLSPPESE